MKYTCEVCKEEYDTELEAALCEEGHEKAEERARAQDEKKINDAINAYMEKYKTVPHLELTEENGFIVLMQNLIDEDAEEDDEDEYDEYDEDDDEEEYGEECDDDDDDARSFADEVIDTVLSALTHVFFGGDGSKRGKCKQCRPCACKREGVDA